MSNKILKTADIHLGITGRLQDSLWAMRVMREYAHRHGINQLVCLGDMFHDRTSIGIDVACAISDYFTESRNKYDQHWITFPGNHDMFLKHSWTINAIKPFNGNMRVINDIKIVIMNGVRFWVLPFIHLETAYMRIVRLIESYAEPGDVLWTHIGVVSAFKNICFMLQDWSIVSFQDSPLQVYTGHFHISQQVGNNVWYPGSPIPYKADEGDCPHGFLVYDLDSRTHEFVDIWKVGTEYFPDEVPPPNYFTVPDDIINNLPQSYVLNNVIRVSKTKEYTPKERDEVEQHLIQLGAKEVRWLNINAERALDETRANLTNINGVSVFDNWLEADKNNLGGYNLDLLRSINNEVVRRGDERYDSSITD